MNSRDASSEENKQSTTETWLELALHSYCSWDDASWIRFFQRMKTILQTNISLPWFRTFQEHSLLIPFLQCAFERVFQPDIAFGLHQLCTCCCYQTPLEPAFLEWLTIHAHVWWSTMKRTPYVHAGIMTQIQAVITTILGSAKPLQLEQTCFRNWLEIPWNSGPYLYTVQTMRTLDLISEMTQSSQYFRCDRLRDLLSHRKQNDVYQGYVYDLCANVFADHYYETMYQWFTNALSHKQYSSVNHYDISRAWINLWIHKCKQVGQTRALTDEEKRQIYQCCFRFLQVESTSKWWYATMQMWMGGFEGFVCTPGFSLDEWKSQDACIALTEIVYGTMSESRPMKWKLMVQPLIPYTNKDAWENDPLEEEDEDNASTDWSKDDDPISYSDLEEDDVVEIWGNPDMNESDLEDDETCPGHDHDASDNDEYCTEDAGTYTCSSSSCECQG